MEEWKEIEKGYEISNKGRIRRNGKDKIKYLKPEITRKGYLRVRVYMQGIYRRVLIHVLVAKFFIPNPLNKEQVNHIDCNKQNNCVENLEWVTGKENMQHASKNKLLNKKKHNINYKKVCTQEELERLKKQGFKKGNIPWNKGKKGLQKHTEEWKMQAKMRMIEANKNKKTPIVCLETGEKYGSQAEASKTKNISQGNICSCLIKKRKTAGGYHWEYIS